MKTALILIQFARALSLALKDRDVYTRLHSDRVMNLSVEIGKKIGVPSDELILLKTAAALHDIGKIGVPDKVLLKTSSLEEQELATMRLHSNLGADIVQSLANAGDEGSDAVLSHDEVAIVASAIRHHHECFNGQGYPNGITGESIPIFARIITIADNYDAMVTRRVYQTAKKHNVVMNIMSEELGYKHDPALLTVFIALIEKSEHRAM